MLDFFKANGKFMVAQRFWSGFRIYDNSISGSSNYRNNLMQDYARLRRLNNLKYPFFIKRKFFWFVNWISNRLLFSIEWYQYLKNISLMKCLHIINNIDSRLRPSLRSTKYYANGKTARL